MFSVVIQAQTISSFTQRDVIHSPLALSSLTKAPRAQTTTPSKAEIKWKFKTGDSVTSSASVAKDGTIIVGSENGYIYALNPDGKESLLTSVLRIFRK